MTTTDAPLAAGVGWLATRRVTLGLVALLFAVFALEQVVRWQFGTRVWRYVFLAHLEGTPGWVLAPFAHRTLPHLAGSVSVIVVYGGLLEGRLSGPAYLGFYLVAGYASTLAQLGSYLLGRPGIGTLGASGAALGLVSFFVTGVALGYLRGTASPSTVEWLFALTATVVVALVVVTDFVPTVARPGTASLGHLGGIAVGVGYGLVRTQQRSGSAPTDGT